MSEAAEKLKTALLELPVAERLEMMDFLYESLPTPPGGLQEGTSEFDAMLQRRAEELESGKVRGVPAEVVLERLRKKYMK